MFGRSLKWPDLVSNCHCSKSGMEMTNNSNLNILAAVDDLLFCSVLFCYLHSFVMFVVCKSKSQAVTSFFSSLTAFGNKMTYISNANIYLILEKTLDTHTYKERQIK